MSLFDCTVNRKQHTVLRKSTGSTGSSTICCITTANISDRKTSVIEKQIPIADGNLTHDKKPKYRVLKPSIVLFKPISFSDSCSNTISSAGVRSSLCRTRGRLDVTLPNVCGGVVTMDSNTLFTSCLFSGVPFSIDTMRGRCRTISACSISLVSKS